jgi:hypothetical protein
MGRLLLVYQSTEKIFNRPVGKTDIKDALGGLEERTQDGVRAVAAQVPKARQGTEGERGSRQYADSVPQVILTFCILDHGRGERESCNSTDLTILNAL